MISNMQIFRNLFTPFVPSQPSRRRPGAMAGRLTRDERNLQPSVQPKRLINHKNFLKILLSVAITVLFFYSLFRRLHCDEFEAIRTAWKVLHDGQMYKDFFQHHHPFFYYLIAPFLKVFGATTNVIYVLRFFIFFMFLGIGYATYVLAKILTSKTVGLLSALILFSIPIFSISAIEIRPDVPMTLCGVWAITLWFCYLRSKKIVHLLASAVLLSIAFLFLQKAIFIMAPLGVVMLAGRTKIKEILLYGLTFAILPGCYAAYLFFTGTFSDYLFFNWLINMKMTGAHPALPHVLFGLLTNIPAWGLFFLGLITIQKNLFLLPIAFLAITLNMVIFFVTGSYPQYLMPAIPFTSIITAYALYRLTVTRKYLFILLTLAIAIPPLGINYIRRPILSPITQQIKKIDYVLSLTTKNDYVLDSEIGFGAFNLFRKDIDYMWYGVWQLVPTYNRLKPYTYDVYQLIMDKKPKVISTLSINMIPAAYKDETKKEVITKFYKPSTLYDDILIRK